MEPPLAARAALGRTISMAWDRLIAADPRRERALLGARVVVTVGLSLLALLGLVRVASMPVAAVMVGVMLALMGSISMQDPDPAALRVTAAWSVVPVAAAIVVGAALPAGHVASSLVFLLVIGGAVAARRWGARGTTLGMVSFFAYFAAQVSGASPAQVPWLLAAGAVSLAVLALVRFGLLRDRPARVLGWVLDAYRRSLAALVAMMAEAAEAGALAERRGEAIRRALRRVNEAAILVEETIGPDDARPFEAELAAEQAFGALAEALARGSLDAQARRETAAVLWRLRAVLRGEWAPEAPGSAPWGEQIPVLRRALDALERAPMWKITCEAHASEAAVSALAAAAPVAAQAPAERASLAAQAPAESAPVAADAPAQGAPVAAEAPSQGAPVQAEAAAEGAPVHAADDPAAGAGAAEAPGGLHAATRQAIQAVVACGLAMVAGRWLSAERWTWAVIAAFVVFSQATTRGESMRRAWHRVVGTVLGAGAGLVLARLVHGLLAAEIGAVFVVLFVGLYLTRVSYAWMVGAMSTLVAVVYDLLGKLTPGLLVLRVDETLIGATIGAVVASVVLPSRTMEKVREAGAALLATTGELLDAVAAGDRPAGERARQVRRLDAQLGALRAAALPLTARPLAVDPVATRLVEASESLVFLARQLAGVPVPEPARRLAAAQLAGRAALTAGVLLGARPAPPVSAARALPAPAPTASMRWLGRIEEALDEVDEAARELRPSHGARAEPDDELPPPSRPLNGATP